MKKFTAVVYSSVEPKDTNVLWVTSEGINIFMNGSWKTAVSSSGETQPLPEEEVNSIINTAVNKVLGGAPADYNTLKKVADYIKADTEALNALESKVSSVENSVPTKVSQLTNDSGYQTQAQVNTAIQKVVGAAPDALDTLEEIAERLKDDNDAISSLASTIAQKANSNEVYTKTQTDAMIGEVVDTIAAIDLSLYETVTGASSKYQPKGNYLTSDSLSEYYTKTESNATFQPKGSYLTSTALDNYYNKTEVDNKIAEAVTSGTVDLSAYETIENAESKYQPKGNYLTENDVLDFAKITDLNNKVDKEDGKGLSANDYSDDSKNTVANIQRLGSVSHIQDNTAFTATTSDVKLHFACVSATGTNPFYTSHEESIPTASATSAGVLTATDYNRFNNKAGLAVISDNNFPEPGTGQFIVFNITSEGNASLEIRESILQESIQFPLLPWGVSGHNGDILSMVNDKPVWVDYDILDLVSYGVEWDIDSTSPVLRRIGNMNYHKTLPIQSGMKGCVLDALNKRVVYWLDEDNWKYKKGGNPSKGEPEQLSRLDGYDGEVMVYVPEFWIKSWSKNGKNSVRISPVKIDDSWEHQPAIFIGAYKESQHSWQNEDNWMEYLSQLRTAGVSTATISNDQSYCAGEGPSNSDIFKDRIQKPITNVSRIEMRNRVRKANKELLSYKEYKNIFVWLYAIEYANLYWQLPVNNNLDSQGYRQGGLGKGVTNITVVSDWEAFNQKYPITPNGYTDSLGNHSGEVRLEGDSITAANDICANRYRGIENPFGDVWTNLDGIGITRMTDTSGNPAAAVYIAKSPSNYGDTLDSLKNMEFKGYYPITGSSAKYIRDFNLGDTADIFPSTLMPTNTIKTGVWYTEDILSTRLNYVVAGGNAVRETISSPTSLFSDLPVTTSLSTVGYRTCQTVTSDTELNL